MSEIDPRNNVVWRLGRLERDVEELKRGQPEVLAERLKHLSEDVLDLRADVKGMKRMIVTVFSGVGIAVIAAVIAIILQGGTA